jgi:hypothetical protein
MTVYRICDIWKETRGISVCLLFGPVVGDYMEKQGLVHKALTHSNRAVCMNSQNEIICHFPSYLLLICAVYCDNETACYSVFGNVI